MAVRGTGGTPATAPETAPGRPPAPSNIDPDPARAPVPGGAFGEASDRDRTQTPDKDRRTEEVPTAGTTAEVLTHKDFAALDPTELAELNRLLSLLALKAPLRRGRRQETDRRGRRIDLRRTLRTGQRTGGEAVLLARTRHRLRRRRLVLLCDISRSMEPYTRAYLRLFPRAAAGAAAEAFVFATRLTRLTPVLRHTGPSGVDAALRRAGAAARLVRRHPHRPRTGRVQQPLRPPGHGTRRRRGHLLRRLGGRGPGGRRPRNGPPRPPHPPHHLGQPPQGGPRLHPTHGRHDRRTPVLRRVRQRPQPRLCTEVVEAIAGNETALAVCRAGRCVVFRRR
jgi:hypothetical protein